LSVLPPVQCAVPARARPLRDAWFADAADPTLPRELLPRRHVCLLRDVLTGGAECCRRDRRERHRRLLAGRCVLDVQLGGVLPRAAADRLEAEPEPAFRGGDEVVPLHLRPDERRGAVLAAAVL